MGEEDERIHERQKKYHHHLQHRKRIRNMSRSPVNEKQGGEKGGGSYRTWKPVHHTRHVYLERGTPRTLYVRRRERWTVTACNWIVRRTGVQGMEYWTIMLQPPQLWSLKTGDAKDR